MARDGGGSGGGGGTGAWRPQVGNGKAKIKELVGRGGGGMMGACGIGVLGEIRDSRGRWHGEVILGCSGGAEM
jgi:hypothetical protein